MSSIATTARPLVVCGPSGVGKGTIISCFMKAHGNDYGDYDDDDGDDDDDYDDDGGDKRHMSR